MNKATLVVSTIVLGVIALTIKLAFVWVCASAIVSGIKSVSKQCDQTYVIEPYLHGDWFCPKK